MPQARRFGPGDESGLTAALDDLARFTTVTEVSDADELVMDDRATLPDGYRMTGQALRQVCDLLAGGLYALMVDLAGVHAPSPGECSVPAAVRVYNSVLRRRGARLVGRIRLLRLLSPVKRVDGVLGVRYHLAHNDEFFARAAEAASGSSRPTSFSEAVLVGRRLSLRFSRVRPLVHVRVGAGVDDYHDGLFFTNSEIGGESSLRAAPTLVRAGTGAFSMGAYLGGGRQAHVGSAFKRKVDRVFAAAASVEQSADLARKRFGALMRTSLGLGFGRDEDVEERADAIASRLVEYGVPKAAGQDAVARAMQGAAPSGPWANRGEAVAGKTAYDLYTGLTAVAQGRYVTTQERLAQAAHKLFKGTVKL